MSTPRSITKHSVENVEPLPIPSPGASVTIVGGLLLSAILLAVPSPIAIPPFNTQAALLGALWSLIAICKSAQWAARRGSLGRLAPLVAAIFLFAAACTHISGLISSRTAPAPYINAVLFVSICLCCAVLIGCCQTLSRSPQVEGPRFVNSMLWMAGPITILSAYCGVISVPAGALSRSVTVIPPLVKEDQGLKAYRELGFRGKRPCAASTCPPNLIRILAMGGSSTNGVPMQFPYRTYSAELQRILDERRIGEHYEVLNAGIAGHGVTQIIAALEEELLKFQPDIVTVCSWFNDAGPAPGWYGVPGLSDAEAYQRTKMLRELQEYKPYADLRAGRTFALLRHYLLGFKDSFAWLGKKFGLAQPAVRPRMDETEFRQALEQIAALGKKHDFLPVFIPEPLDRTYKFSKTIHNNDYYQVTKQVADAEGIPLIDVVTPLSEHRGEWMFYDFIHPNTSGHRLIAESISAALFDRSPSDLARNFWNSRGVDLTRPTPRRDPLLQFNAAILPKKLIVSARAPFGLEGSALRVTENERIIAVMPQLRQTLQEFQIPLYGLSRSRPIIDLRFEAVFPAGHRGFPVGTTQRYSPVFLEVESGGKDYGWTVAVRVQNTRYDQAHRGYNAAVVGAKSGRVLKSGLFDIFVDHQQNYRMAEFIDAAASLKEQGAPPIVILAVHTDGRMNSNPEVLSAAFRSLGGTGRLAEPFQSFILIGSPGAKPGTALEQMGPQFLHVELGDRSFLGADLLEIEAGPNQGLL